MENYVQPQAEILLFLPRQALAAQAVTEPTLNEGIDLSSPPEISEGVEDW